MTNQDWNEVKGLLAFVAWMALFFFLLVMVVGVVKFLDWLTA